MTTTICTFERRVVWVGEGPTTSTDACVRARERKREYSTKCTLMRRACVHV